MLSIGRIGEETTSEKWYIVRKLDDEIMSHNFVYVPELAPSPALFSVYKKLRDNNEWDAHALAVQYLPVFLQEMTAAPAQEKLRYLTAESRKRNIVLCCYCERVALCRRSIVGGILKGMGAEIRGCDAFLAYYRMYQELLGR